MIKVLYFGRLSELMKTPSVELEGFEDTEQLMSYLYQQEPSLAEQTFQLALNHKIVSNKQALKAGDELALMPPFAGG